MPVPPPDIPSHFFATKTSVWPFADELSEEQFLRADDPISFGFVVSESAQKVSRSPTRKLGHGSKVVRKSIAKPKRALTAYNYFYSRERAKLVGVEPPSAGSLLYPGTRRPHRKTHGKVTFLELSKVISARWKMLDTEGRAVHQNKASEDLKRYEKEMNVYKRKVHASMKANCQTNSRRNFSEDLPGSKTCSVVKHKSAFGDAGAMGTATREAEMIDRRAEMDDTIKTRVSIGNICYDYEPSISRGAMSDLENDLSITLGQDFILALAKLEESNTAH